MRSAISWALLRRSTRHRPPGSAPGRFRPIAAWRRGGCYTRGRRSCQRREPAAASPSTLGARSGPRPGQGRRKLPPGRDSSRWEAPRAGLPRPPNCSPALVKASCPGLSPLPGFSSEGGCAVRAAPRACKVPGRDVSCRGGSRAHQARFPLPRLPGPPPPGRTCSEPRSQGAGTRSAAGRDWDSQVWPLLAAWLRAACWRTTAGERSPRLLARLVRPQSPPPPLGTLG